MCYGCSESRRYFVDTCLKLKEASGSCRGAGRLILASAKDMLRSARGLVFIQTSLLVRDLVLAMTSKCCQTLDFQFFQTFGFSKILLLLLLLGPEISNVLQVKILST